MKDGTTGIWGISTSLLDNSLIAIGDKESLPYSPHMSRQSKRISVSAIGSPKLGSRPQINSTNSVEPR